MIKKMQRQQALKQSQSNPILSSFWLSLLVPGVCFAWQQAAPEDVALDPAKLQQARDYALTGGGSGYIVRHGKLVMSWGDQAQRYDLKSTTKSIGVTALGLALMDGRIAMDDKASLSDNKNATEKRQRNPQGRDYTPFTASNPQYNRAGCESLTKKTENSSQLRNLG
jgi:CubicO group peptidase (beta-lactamase class C family)